MQFFTVFEFVVLAVILLRIIWSYSQKDVPMYVRILTFISWYGSIGMILLLPLDIYMTREKEKGITDYDDDLEAVKFMYNFLFWGVFLLAWTFIPVAQGYEDSVRITVKGRLKESLYWNGLFYLAILVAAMIFLGVVVSTKMAGEAGLMPFILCLANSWGIFLIMVLLGYSLVTIPQQHWRTQDMHLQMKYLQFKAYQQVENQKECIHRLKMAITRVLIFEEKAVQTDEIKQYIGLCYQRVPTDFILKCRDEYHENYLEQSKFLGKKLDAEEAVKILYEVRQAYAEVRRSRCSWNQLTKSAFLLEDVINNINNPRQHIESPLRTKKTGPFAEERERLRWYWFVHWKQRVKGVWAVLLGILSFIVLWDETMLFLNWREYAIIEKILHLYLDDPNVGYVACQIVCAVPLSYIIFNCYYGFFKLKITGFYGIYPNNNTDGPSLMFTAVNFSRLPGALCFNFLNIISYNNSAFSRIMGDVDLVPVFGSQVTPLFPLLMILFAFMNLFDVWSRIFTYFGMKQFIFSPSFSDACIDEGRKILARKREIAEHKALHAHHKDASHARKSSAHERYSVLMNLIEKQDADIASASEEVL